MSIRKIIQWSGGVFCILLTSIICMAAYQQDVPVPKEDGRWDGIFIQETEKGMKDEMPPVLFLHDLHTQALKGKDCATCHLKDTAGQYAFQFMQAAETAGDARMTLFHDNCIGCHDQMRKDGRDSGPETENCRACHQQTPKTPVSRKILSFDHALHYRHVSADTIKPTAPGMDGNCGNCHHEYDKDAKKTVYAPGKEGACAYCHLETDTDPARALETVYHEACVNCHKSGKDKKLKETGPVNCLGCHADEGLKAIKTVASVPRMKRNQPDAVFMATSMKKAVADGEKPQLMAAPVAFNHLAHEKSVDSCKTCHHAALDECIACHTVTGDKKGGYIPLEKAMHDINDPASCVGCHRQTQKKNECAGCHVWTQQARPEQTACNSCHQINMADASALPMNEEQQTAAALAAVAERKIPPLAYTDTEVPDTVIIDTMKDTYEGAVLPHRKIVHTLLAGINKDGMGTWFHSEKYTMCQGCHHNSPMKTGVPPKCAACHNPKPGKKTDGGRPGLTAAYHTQCMGCHNQMGIEKPAATDCVACHKEKK